MTDRGKSIVLGVTSAQSLILMAGLPERLVDEGWDVHVVADREQFAAVPQSAGVTAHDLRMSREPSPLKDALSLWRWLRLLRCIRPDVVFVGTPKAGLLGIVSARLVRVPSRVYHLRGLRLETVTGPKRHVFAALERLTMAWATSTIAVSESLRRRVVELGLGKPSKVVVLGAGSSNGVDLERFHGGEPDDELRGTLGLDPGLPVVGFVGRVTRDKGGPELASASVELSRRGVLHQLLIVGKVEQAGAQDEFEKILGSGDAPVVYTGHVADTAPYYRLMTVFCLPTHREGFPNVVLEAAASGTFVVTTDATGAIDSVVDGETGLIVQVGDVGSLAAALEHALGDRDARRRVVDTARQRVQQFYDRDRVQRSLIALLDVSPRPAHSAMDRP